LTEGKGEPSKGPKEERKGEQGPILQKNATGRKKESTKRKVKKKKRKSQRKRGGNGQN